MSKVSGRLLVLAGAVALNALLINQASAGPISSYDALDNFDLTIALSNGATDDGASVGATKLTTTGSGQTEDTLESSAGPPPELSIFLHAFGSGTGSSEVAGFASRNIIGPATGAQYEIDITWVTRIQTVSANATPPGTASAVAAEDINIPGATFIGDASSGLCPAGVDICYDAVGDATVTLEGDVSGDAFTPTVPEPATLALLGVGLAGLGFSRRRKLN